MISKDQKREALVVLSALSFLAGIIIFICISLAYYALNPPTCSDCLQTCEEKHQLDIDDSWINCDLECIKKHGENACYHK